MSRTKTICVATLLTLGACQSPVDLLGHIQVQMAIAELDAMVEDGEVPAGCAFDYAGNSPPNLEATWTTSACEFTYGQLNKSVGQECAMSLTLDYQSGDRIEQINEGQVSSGSGETFITGPIPEADEDNATLWIYNHADGDYGCSLDSAAIMFMLESPDNASLWSFCMLTVVLWQNGNSTCPQEDWWVAQGTMTRY